MLNKVASEFLRMAVHKQPKLNRDCEPNVVRSKYKLVVLVVCSDNAVNKTVLSSASRRRIPGCFANHSICLESFIVKKGAVLQVVTLTLSTLKVAVGM